MSRPFSLTMQAHQLDFHRLWLTLLVLFSLFTVAWGVWAASAHLVLYETSSDIRLTEQFTRTRSLEEQGNVYRTRTWRERILEARFPQAARKKLESGQDAMIYVRGDSGEELVAAKVSEVHDEPAKAAVRVVLRAAVLDDTIDPFVQGTPSRVRVAVATVSPLSLLLSDRSAAGPTPP